MPEKFRPLGPQLPDGQRAGVARQLDPAQVLPGQKDKKVQSFFGQGLGHGAGAVHIQVVPRLLSSSFTLKALWIPGSWFEARRTRTFRPRTRRAQPGRRRKS